MKRMTPLQFFEKYNIRYENIPGAWRSEVEVATELVAYAVVKGLPDIISWSMIFKDRQGVLRGMMNGWPADLGRTRKFMNSLRIEKYSRGKKEDIDKAQLMEDI